MAEPAAKGDFGPMSPTGRSGERFAVWTLHEKSVRAYVCMLTGRDEGAADDIYDETLERFLASDTFDTSKSATARSYLCQIAHNVFLRVKRYTHMKQQHQASLITRESERTRQEPLDELAKAELREMAVAALTGLPAKKRNAVLLFARGVSYQAIAEQLDVSETTARTYVHESLDVVRARFIYED